MLKNINEARNKVEAALTLALAGSVWSQPRNKPPLEKLA
jgi:hypothetical protein